MKKMVAIIAGMLLALPAMAFAATGIVGQCSDCHTMHNSQQGQPVAIVGSTGTTSASPIQNLLKMDCVACHANPDATGPTLTLPGGSTVPQVDWANPSTDITTNLAGGNFYYSDQNQRHGHNVIDLTAADDSNAGNPADTATYGAPPGMAHADHHGLQGGVFSSSVAFDAFTCAGARGCHGTRSQLLSGDTADWDNNASTPNTYQGVRRTGIAAISGAHHNSQDGLKDPAAITAPYVEDGAVVAAGYRFIPGLIGYGNETDRWQNKDATSHNEYYGNVNIQVGADAGCQTCHVEGTVVNGNAGLNPRADLNSTLTVPGQAMSGFCSTCHGAFHSSGENGTSSAFLRHPSDWVLPTGGEYTGYTTYNVTAPVARPLADFAPGMTASNQVTAGQDMVMCLSCHEAHASPYDYMLRFDYTQMTAGGYASIAAAQGNGGCLACHTQKGVLPANR
jgi:predicted CXXCH cytochrome family protein